MKNYDEAEAEAQAEGEAEAEAEAEALKRIGAACVCCAFVWSIKIL